MQLDIYQAIDQILDAYEYVQDFISEESTTYSLTLDESLKSPLHIINSYLSNFIVPTFQSYEVVPFAYESGERKALLFSGGKVSTAVASMYKRKEEDITLIYFDNSLAGVNTIKPNRDKALKIADLLGMEIIIIREAYNIYNPLFIMRLIADAIPIIIQEGFSLKILTGLLYGTSVNNNPFNLIGYSREFVDAEKTFLQKYLPEFDISMPMPSMSFAWDELMRRKEVIPYMICKDEVERLTSYIMQTDYDIIEPDEETYLRNFRRLKHIYLHDMLVRQATDKEVWKRYFFYNMSYSKFLKHSS